jgi:hypothetical protein
MTKLPKFFLIVSLVSFALGAVVCVGDLDLHPSWAVAVPVGAIFFGLFLIAYMLQGEVAKFNEEAAKNAQQAISQVPMNKTKVEDRTSFKQATFQLAMTR